ncbi:hypothetical protein J3X97_003595 [Salmonella enterica]|nr:hypothetical protein [Salmonella enterica]
MDNAARHASPQAKENKPGQYMVIIDNNFFINLLDESRKTPPYRLVITQPEAIAKLKVILHGGLKE